VTDNMKLPRGIRRNNPGNIKELPGDKTQWQGERATDDDPVFEEFTTPQMGIRALAVILRTYQRRHDIRTVRRVIGRWAPPLGDTGKAENNTEAYIKAVAKSTGFDPDKVLDLTTLDHMLPLVKAIIQHENGQQPYDDKTLTEGLAAAGIVKT